MCDRTGAMVAPWLDAGYECWVVDTQHPAGAHRDGNLVRVGADVRTWLPRRYVLVVRNHLQAWKSLQQYLQ
jgi:hypothetical protein